MRRLFLSEPWKVGPGINIILVLLRADALGLLTNRGRLPQVLQAPANASATDGVGQRNSPFTTALLKHIVTPGLEVRSMLTRVRADVMAATQDQQIPWDHSSLVRDDVMLVPSDAGPRISSPAPPSASPANCTALAQTASSMTACAMRQAIAPPASARASLPMPARSATSATSGTARASAMSMRSARWGEASETKEPPKSGPH